MQKHLTEFHIHMDKPSRVKKNTGRSRVWCQRAVTPVVWETEGGLSQSGVLREADWGQEPSAQLGDALSPKGKPRQKTYLAWAGPWVQALVLELGE